MKRLEFKSDWLLPDAIVHHAKFSGSRAAVICDDEVLTWRELESRTRKVANALLGVGIQKGDKVCLFMGSSLRSFEIFWGIIRAGGVVVALNVLMAKVSLATMVNNSDGKLLFSHADQLPEIEAIAGRLETIDRDHIYIAGGSVAGWKSLEDFVEGGSDEPLDVRIHPEDSINIVYSSGSTGIPKGIEHSHRARFEYIFGLGHYHAYDQSAVALLATPIYTNGTWMTMSPCMYRGGTCVIMRKFSAEGLLRTVEKHKVTHVFLVPTQIISVLDSQDFANHDLSSLRVFIASGQALMSATFDRIIAQMPSTTQLWEAYGMSECFCTMAGPKDWALGKRGSVGKSFVLDDICIVGGDDKELPQGEIGEICGYSVGMMKGYYKDTERTDEMIWIGPGGRTYIRSGDLGRIDEDGYLYVCGRTKDMIKSGGINVFPADIETVFMRHPDVIEAAAIGIPHAKWIETPLLFVILRDSVSSPAPEELMAWGNERLGKFQRISAIKVVKELPRVTYGKIDKKKLRAPYWSDAEHKTA
jgi:acyl-CoA synthetase (AMP-forming)/AMP-acid ligase II